MPAAPQHPPVLDVGGRVKSRSTDAIGHAATVRQLAVGHDVTVELTAGAHPPEPAPLAGQSLVRMALELPPSAGDLAVPVQMQRDRLDGAGRQRVAAIHPQFDAAGITQPHVDGMAEHPPL